MKNINHNIKELIWRIPADTVEVKKEFCKDTGISDDKLNRWFNDSEYRISAQDAFLALKFFRKYFPKLQYEDLFETNTTANNNNLNLIKEKP